MLILRKSAFYTNFPAGTRAFESVISVVLSLPFLALVFVVFIDEVDTCLHLDLRFPRLGIFGNLSVPHFSVERLPDL